MTYGNNLRIARLISILVATATVLALAPSLARAAGSKTMSTCGAGVFQPWTQPGITTLFNRPYNPAPDLDRYLRPPSRSLLRAAHPRPLVWVGGADIR